MKDLSFFLLKNTFGAKMKKGISNLCNGDGSTSTLNQKKINNKHGDSSCTVTPTSLISSPYMDKIADTPTLEEMILQLELEEEMTRKAKLEEYGRMSCVNNSDILRSARNALNQYPRFSLDGKDAMYRSSFRNLDPFSTTNKRSIYPGNGLGDKFHNRAFVDSSTSLPPTLAGESVIWRKPGVVAKLMGLEAMPVPISNKVRKERLSMMRKRSLRREMLNINGGTRLNRGSLDYCTATGYRVVKPIAVQPLDAVEAAWPTRRFS